MGHQDIRTKDLQGFQKACNAVLSPANGHDHAAWISRERGCGKVLEQRVHRQEVYHMPILPFSVYPDANSG